MDFELSGARDETQMQSIMSIVSLLREKGGLTEPASRLLALVAARWGSIKIIIQSGQQPFVAGGTNRATEIVLSLRRDMLGTCTFAIISQDRLVSAPLEAPRDPGCSNSILRAIAGAVTLAGFEFSRTVYPELAGTCSEFTMPLSQASKPDALALAQNIWTKVASQVPRAGMCDHTDKDSMGTTNLGTMFKVCNMLKAQGALTKYRLNVIP
jgi:hypothetical protein